MSLDPEIFGGQTLNHHLGGSHFTTPKWCFFITKPTRDTFRLGAIQHLMDQGQNFLENPSITQA